MQMALGSLGLEKLAQDWVWDSQEAGTENHSKEDGEDSLETSSRRHQQSYSFSLF